jgi:hypothetical protein
MTLDESGTRTADRPRAGRLPRARLYRTLPEPVAALLRSAQAEEQQAVGARRRGAFLLTRHIIGGLLHAGFPARLIALELGVRSESVRTRAQSGWIGLDELSLLTGAAEEELLQRARDAGCAAAEGQLHSDDLAALLLGSA